MTLPDTYREYYLPKYEGIQSLTIRQVAIPPVKSSQVLVKVHAVSLNYRDLVVANGTYVSGFKDQVVPCSDMGGEIVAVGDEVKNWKVGDRVSSNFTLDHVDGDITADIRASALGSRVDGVLREYMVLPAHALVRIANSLTYEEASTLPCAGVTAYNTLNGPKPVKAGDTVLVLGTGGVSIFGLQLAATAGAEVICTSSSDTKLEKAKELGARHVINYKKTPNWDEEVLKLTNGKGVDHIFEVGGAGTLPHSVKAVRYAGWIHVIGFLAETADVSRVPIDILRKGAFLRGIQNGSVRQFNEMNKQIEACHIKPVIDKLFDFDHAKDAYEHLKSQNFVGKVVIRVSQS